MQSALLLLPRLLLALSLTLVFSCATSQPGMAGSQSPSSEPKVVQATRLPGEQLQLIFEPAPLDPSLETLTAEEVRSVLADFLLCVENTSQFQVLPVLASSPRGLAPWEARLRAEFLARYGPGLLPLPDSLERSPLFMALRLSPRYMGPGLRDAARELFRSPIFLASVTLSILVYFSAWVLPEPLFSKAFAATLTARLAG